MLKRLKTDFESGIEKMKWFSSMLADRLKIELSVVKLLYHSAQMEKKKDELMETIGKRVYELKEHTDRHILKDSIIIDAMHKIQQIDTEIESAKKKASEISKAEI